MSNEYALEIAKRIFPNAVEQGRVPKITRLFKTPEEARKFHEQFRRETKPELDKYRQASINSERDSRFRVYD
ncbi:MAG: hypothetical protein LBU87_02915 [Lactobacillales bacterium]|jgi:hypothetical protein|nr:hypothetical protein [Lactobacillales bacterium]